jgi:hypothetical protein
MPENAKFLFQKLSRKISLYGITDTMSPISQISSAIPGRHRRGDLKGLVNPAEAHFPCSILNQSRQITPPTLP